MYSKVKIGRELKEKINQKLDLVAISDWAHALYVQYLTDAGSNLDDVLLVLVMMDAGPEFELSYERLNEIADQLIADENVKL